MAKVKFKVELTISVVKTDLEALLAATGGEEVTINIGGQTISAELPAVIPLKSGEKKKLAEAPPEETAQAPADPQNRRQNRTRRSKRALVLKDVDGIIQRHVDTGKESIGWHLRVMFGCQEVTQRLCRNSERYDAGRLERLLEAVVAHAAEAMPGITSYDRVDHAEWSDERLAQDWMARFRDHVIGQTPGKVMFIRPEILNPFPKWTPERVRSIWVADIKSDDRRQLDGKAEWLANLITEKEKDRYTDEERHEILRAAHGVYSRRLDEVCEGLTPRFVSECADAIFGSVSEPVSEEASEDEGPTSEPPPSGEEGKEDSFEETDTDPPHDDEDPESVPVATPSGNRDKQKARLRRERKSQRKPRRRRGDNEEDADDEESDAA